MYNAEIKERFLSENKGWADVLLKLFDSISDYEESNQKDFSEMSRAEVILYLNNVGFLELSSLDTTISGLKRYSKWCVSQGFVSPEQSGILQISTDGIDPSVAMSKMFFRDEQDFLYSMRKVADFEDLQNGVIALCLGWLGLTARESVALRDGGVDLVSRTISEPSGTVIVNGFSDDIARIFELYRATKTATRQNGNDTRTVIKDLSHDGFIKRVCSPTSVRIGEQVSGQQINTYVSKMNQKYTALGYSPRFSMENANRCGGLYRLWKLENDGVEVLNKQNAGIVEQVYGHGVYRKIAWQYKFYKKAFNL